MPDQNAAVKAGAWWMGGEREGDARHGTAASRWVVQWRVTAAAGKDVAAYFTGNQDRRNVFILGRSGPDRVPGN